MKILFVISQFYKGGAEMSLLNLLKNIDASIYDVDLMIMNQCPVQNAVSLIPELPPYVNVIDVFKMEHSMTYEKRILRKYLCSSADLEQYGSFALLYIRIHQYEWAFHIGEWWSPAFVARHVKAKKKAVWIHTDISAAPSFQCEEFFQYDSCIDYYIFVSEKSLTASVREFRFLKKRSVCIYNISDVSGIREKSTQIIANIDIEKPVVLTCANIRREKNHRRQLEAMKLLIDRGIEFTWVNIGSTTDTTLTNALIETAKGYGLEDRFLLLGPKENPYPYIAQADVVAVLSDYESWSMVITEAKILGTPVIATRTSGALEQIEDQKTGILTEFTAEDIAEKLEIFLQSKQLQRKIRDNICSFDNTQEILNSFYDLINSQRNSEYSLNANILYVIDDINYKGGAHIATKNQIRLLIQKEKQVTIFSPTLPTVSTRNEFEGAKIIGWFNCPESRLYERRLLDCLMDPSLNNNEKKYKAKLTYESKIKRNPCVFDEFVKPQLSQMFSQYDVICVMSEGSVFRREVGESSSKRKVQYIHTDYAEWRNLSEWSRTITKDDAEIYDKFDRIVLLSEKIKNRFLAIYPGLDKKIVVNQNVLPDKEIRQKAEPIQVKGTLIKFVTVGRIDHFKGFDRIYIALNRLYEEGYQFQWTVIGDGEEFESVKTMFEHSEYSERIKMKGNMENPFREMKNADVFALFSRYEGIPNTIYEAMILGVPVIATNVGGISSQIEEGTNGWLVDNDDDSIYYGLKHIFDNPEEIETYKNNLKDYQYDNNKVMNMTEQILFG